jgi:hypothetical protein
MKSKTGEIPQRRRKMTELGEKTSKKITDYRSKKFTYNLFLIENMKLIETYNSVGDWVIMLKDGSQHIYRCSCCITFQDNKLIVS